MLDIQRQSLSTQLSGLAAIGTAYLGRPPDRRPMEELLKEKRAELEATIDATQERLAAVNAALDAIEEWPRLAGVIDTLRKVGLL